jgi:hypothetical protein
MWRRALLAVGAYGVLLGAAGCQSDYLVSVENASSQSVEASFVYDAFLQDPQVLTSRRLQEGERVEFGPYEVPPLEMVYVEARPSRDRYELPTRFRLGARRGTLIVEDDDFGATRPLRVRWEETEPSSDNVKYTHPDS